jgi:hypothetical protein
MSAANENSPMPIALAVVVDRVSAELDKVSSRLQILDDAVAELAAASSVGHAMFPQLQELDRVSQEVGCLTRFLSALAARIPGDWSVDFHEARSSVSLEALAAALAMDLTDAPHPQSLECELF